MREGGGLRVVAKVFDGVAGEFGIVFPFFHLF